MKKFFRKLLYYSDCKLLLFIFWNIIIVALTPSNRRLKLVQTKGCFDSRYPKEKVERYVTFVYFVMGRLWIRPSCFTNSVAVCRVFKKKGIDAKIVFGCSFDEQRLKGHCWVEVGRKAAPGTFQPIFSYPG